MRKVSRVVVAFLTAVLTPVLACTAVRAPVSVYATAQESLGISGDAALTEPGEDVASIADATPTDETFASGEPFAALAVTLLDIEQQPANLHIESGSSAEFSVEAVGDDIAYQWQASSPEYGNADWVGDVIWDDIPNNNFGISGANTSKLSISEECTVDWDDTG